MTEHLEWLEMKKCRTCGKKFSVLYPHLWAYKDGTKFYCSWKCLRADEKKEKKDMRRLTPEERQKAVDICLQGGSARQYLEDLGFASPDAAWYSIRKKLKETDPETWAKVQETIPPAPFRKQQKPETPEAKLPKAEIPEEPKKPVKTYQPTAICTDFGEFYYDRKFSTIDLRTESGDEISLGPAVWRCMAEEMPDILQALGVKL